MKGWHKPFLLASLAAAGLLAHGAERPRAQQPEAEWVKQLAPAPEEAVRVAAEALRRTFGDDRIEKYFELDSARTYPEEDPRVGPLHQVAFSFRIEAGADMIRVPVSVWLNQHHAVVRTEGVVNCQREPLRCPPFALGRAQAVERARRAGLRPGEKPGHCPTEESYQGYCVRLYFFAGALQRYVWGVENKERRGWDFWRPAWWWGGERGRVAIIDPATGEVYQVGGWHTITDYAR